MFVRRTPCLSGAAILIVFGVCVASSHAQSQDGAAAAPPEHQHEGHTMSTAEHAGHDMSDMAREGSGTSWLPDASPIYALHAQKGAWTLMLHENAFLQWLYESGERGDDQLGSVNWVMGMARRPLGRGRLTLRGMISLEPWSIRDCGYPDLLATGEECRGEQIHDRQHPHDLFMELAVEYNAPLAGELRWQVYAGPAGEPALGPVAFPHRISALPNPLAPIAHHWLDSTHVSFGVVTGGMYGKRWKAEGSVFNGREPDEHRTDVDFGALDSYSGRFSFLPTSHLALQLSAGRLNDAEASPHDEARIDVTRVTASATYQTNIGDNHQWATTIAWGLNDESERTSNALLVETSLTLAERDTFYGRFETAGKSAHDLVVPEPPDAFTVAKLQGGYTRYLRPWLQLQPGVGAGASLSVVPETLESVYGSRTNAGAAVYITLRPAQIR
jgi:hypothetical protein